MAVLDRFYCKLKGCSIKGNLSSASMELVDFKVIAQYTNKFLFYAGDLSERFVYIHIKHAFCFVTVMIMNGKNCGHKDI